MNQKHEKALSTTSDYKKAIIAEIMRLAGSRSPYDVFDDWITCMAIAIQNSLIIYGGRELMQVKEDREQQYQRIVSQYDHGVEKFSEMFNMLTMAMERSLTDMLGEIYMESDMGNKSTGQFFTPFSVSRICAALTLGDPDPNSMEPITINEPSCGSGGMIIAAAANLYERGINYQRRLKVVAQDLDWKAVYMCYVQLSLYGIRATVVQGDTLSDPFLPEHYPLARVWKTPGEMGLLI